MVAPQPPPAEPLAELARKLLCWPPSVSRIIQLLGNCEAFSRFVEIVDAYLPEHRALILSHCAMEDQVARFAAAFEEKYFPLHPSFRDGMVEEYEQVTMGIPTAVQGIPYDDYYDLSWFRPGILLMTSLIDIEREGQIPLVEECKKHVPADILKDRPRLSIQDAEDLLTDTSYKGLIHWARIWDHSSGCYFLDATEEETGYEQIEWDPENVAALKKAWDESRIYEDVADRLAAWLEEDIANNYKTMIDFIKEAQNAKRTRSVPMGHPGRPGDCGRPSGDAPGLSS